MTDPAGDDNGPVVYTYPTDGAFNPGSLDLTGLQVNQTGKPSDSSLRPPVPINNPWGGTG